MQQKITIDRDALINDIGRCLAAGSCLASGFLPDGRAYQIHALITTEEDEFLDFDATPSPAQPPVNGEEGQTVVKRFLHDQGWLHGNSGSFDYNGIAQLLELFLSSITPPASPAKAEQEGPWYLKAHSYQIADTGDYDGFYEIRDGLISIMTKDGDEEGLQEVVNALNASGCKFYLDDSVEVENHLLKLEIEELREQLREQEGLRWVKASERLPENVFDNLDPRNNVHSMFTEISGWTKKGAGNFFSDGDEVFCDLGNNYIVQEKDFDRLFWLESAPKEAGQVDPATVLNWLQGQGYFDYTHEHKSGEELLAEYIESLNKQP